MTPTIGHYTLITWLALKKKKKYFDRIDGRGTYLSVNGSSEIVRLHIVEFIERDRGCKLTEAKPTN